ncbi:MBL fold metallo-hydrolase [Paenibacillus bovis]|uniref:Hydrolase n=1 Tax=Paenibacillus bovis TaxID=1616788 RepID=A0A172ZKN1_9BACL|nr:MBL fold metallo-hydrolase [Paenibacillus bovis]ANF98103.1 hydrolase [Paenibacillus bovis]
MKLPEITRGEHEIIQVKIAMSYPLRWVNSYLIGGSSGWSIVDPGPRSADNEQAWQHVLDTLGIPLPTIRSIVLTHHHPDHYGLSGWFQQQCGMPVWISERALAEANRSWSRGNTAASDLVHLFASHGMPEEITSRLPAHLDSFVPQVVPQPEVTFIQPGQMLEIGDRLWETIETSGHAAGHISFYQPEQRLMLCGDAVLPQISPNISLVPGSDPSPLESYLTGLRQLGQYEVDLAYPGHRRPFTHFRDRTEKLLLHHEERLQAMEDRIRDQPRTGYEVCSGLFNNELTLHQLRFAMSETLAHLVELERLGRAVRQEQGGIISFSAK